MNADAPFYLPYLLLHIIWDLKWTDNKTVSFQALKECFESQNIPLLQETIAKMPEEEARYHMKRCVDSGLWVPEGGKKAEEGEEAAAEAGVYSDDVD